MSWENRPTLRSDWPEPMGETEMYTISGLDTEQTPATIEWKVVAEDFPANDITQANLLCTPYLLAAYNSCLEIKAGRVVSLIP